MQWLLFFSCVLQVYSFPSPGARHHVHMATIDLDTARETHIYTGAALDNGAQPHPVKRNATQAPDNGDHDDSELIAGTKKTTISPHFSEKREKEIRDGAVGLMDALHTDELLLRTTVAKPIMTLEPTTTLKTLKTTHSSVEMLRNETLLFDDEEGSGKGITEEKLQTLAMTSTPIATTPLSFTKLIPETAPSPSTALPDSLADLDYDLSQPSLLSNPKSIQERPERLRIKLHDGEVRIQTLTMAVDNSKKPAPVLSRAEGSVKKNTNNLQEMRKIVKIRKALDFNKRVLTLKRKRVRKVSSKVLFGEGVRDGRVAKLILVESDGIVTPEPLSAKKIQKITTTDSKKRDKRDDPPVYSLVFNQDGKPQKRKETDPEDTKTGGAWNNEPIEMAVVESKHVERRHLKYNTKTEVEPSRILFEKPMKSDLFSASSGGNRAANEPTNKKISILKSVKKSNATRKNTTGVAMVAPAPGKPTMLELLIQDFLERIPPNAQNPYLSEKQWL